MDKTPYYKTLLGECVEVVYSKFGEDKREVVSGEMYAIVSPAPEEEHFISIGVKNGSSIIFVDSDTNKIISIRRG